MSRPVLYTIGHSTRSIDEFLALLEAHGIETLVDVGTIPRSRHDPQYEQAARRGRRERAHIRYRHMPRLAGRRQARKGSRVLHIQSRKTATVHRRTPFLRVRGGQLLYPAPASSREGRTGKAAREGSARQPSARPPPAETRPGRRG